MLLKTAADYANYLRTAKHLEFAELEPFFKKIQTDLIQEIFGLTFITNLDTRYNATSPSPALTSEENVLILHLQNAISSFGMVKAIPNLIVNVMGSGLEQAGKKPVYEWQKLAFQDELIENGWNAINTAIIWLHANRDHAQFSTWKNSDEEKLTRSYLFNKTKEFNNEVQIANSTRTFEALKASIKEALDLYIKPLLGSSLYTEILTQNKSFSLSDNNKILVQMIRPAAAHLAMSIGIYKLDLQFTEEGARIVSTSSSSGGKAKVKTAPTEDNKYANSSNFRSTGYTYLATLKDYLQENAATYPLFVDTGVAEVDNSVGSTVVL